LVDRHFGGEFTFNDDGTIYEYGATTCGHGNEVMVLKPERELGIDYFLCPHCMHVICLKCARKQAALKGECIVFEERLEMMEGRKLPKIDREKAWILER
jgi:hypothetical protein